MFYYIGFRISMSDNNNNNNNILLLKELKVAILYALNLLDLIPPLGSLLHLQFFIYK
jgi:hypothetical protein